MTTLRYYACARCLSQIYILLIYAVVQKPLNTKKRGIHLALESTSRCVYLRHSVHYKTNLKWAQRKECRILAWPTPHTHYSSSLLHRRERKYYWDSGGRGGDSASHGDAEQHEKKSISGEPCSENVVCSREQLCRNCALSQRVLFTKNMAAQFYERNTRLVASCFRNVQFFWNVCYEVFEFGTFSGMNADRFMSRLTDESTVNTMQRHYWTARQFIRTKLGKKVSHLEENWSRGIPSGRRTPGSQW